MPSRAFTDQLSGIGFNMTSFNALTGLSCYGERGREFRRIMGRFNALMGLSCYSICRRFAYEVDTFQCPHGLELLR